MTSSKIFVSEESVLNASATILSVSREHMTLLGLTESQISALETSRTDCETLHAKCKSPSRSHVDTAAKNKAFETFNGKLRKFIQNHIVHNDAMTPQILAEFGLDSDDAGGKVKVVQRPPKVSVDTSVIRELRFSHSVKGSKRKGKPPKKHGCKYRYLISDHPPASIAELVNVEVATGQSLRLKFSEADRGKKVYFAACWVSESGDKDGEYTEILVAIIP
jgi:hypothetical protein